MELKLKKIKIENFKGIENLEFKFKDGVNVITGANGSGKSSVLDIVYWILFGKTQDDRKKFSAFPLDGNGELIPGKFPLGELTIERGGEKEVIKRMYKKDTMVMSINDMPYKATEFVKWVTDAISTDTTFKMFINPLFIMEALKPKEQRALFLTFFDMPSKTEVLEQMKKDKKKVIKKFTNLLDQGHSGVKILEYVDTKKKELTTQISKTAGKIELLEDQIGEIKLDISKPELTAKRDRIQFEVNEYDKKLTESSRNERERNRLFNEIKNKESMISDFKANQTRRLDFAKEEKLREIARTTSSKEDLSEEFKRLTKTEFKTKCPTCGQNVPITDLDTAKATLKTKLEKIVIEGKELAAKIKEQKAELTKLKAMKSLPSDRNTLRTYTSDLKKAQKGFEALPELVSLPPITDLTGELRALNETLLKFDNSKKLALAKADNIKLSANYASELETVERVGESCRDYENTKAMIVVRKVNKNFKRIKVELFEKLKNGSYRDTFMVTIDGVPYPDANTASKLETGIELSRFVASKQDLFFPILIDNMERYTDVELPEGIQMILCKAVKGESLELNKKFKGVK